MRVEPLASPPHLPPIGDGWFAWVPRVEASLARRLRPLRVSATIIV